MIQLSIKDHQGRVITKSFDITPEDIDRWRSGNHTFQECFPHVTKATDCVFLIEAIRIADQEKETRSWKKRFARLTSSLRGIVRPTVGSKSETPENQSKK